MSHNPPRKEPICLNCKAQVHGRFCHVCGQENIETKESFWSLTKHFVYDVLHFDGKFFHTIGYIFTKPGLVAKHYTEGKRASYLHPIRMYLFTSAVFFLVFFSAGTIEIGVEDFSGNLDNDDRQELAAEWQKLLDKNPSDSLLRQRILILKDSTRTVNPDALEWPKDTKALTIGNRSYASLQEYDSVQASLPPKDRDGWLAARFIKQGIKIKTTYGYNKQGAQLFVNLILHKLPYLLFVSLPFFALILKLLYIRRKQFFYSDHAIFTLFHYILSFILLLLLFGVDALHEWSGWGIFNFLYIALILLWPVYLYIQMKRFYGQGYFKTFGKFLLLNFLGLIVLLLLFVLFLVLSIFQA